MCYQESLPLVTTWAPVVTIVVALTETTVVALTGMTVMTAEAMTAVMISAVRNRMTAAMKVSAKMTVMEVGRRFTGESEMAAVVMKAAPDGVEMAVVSAAGIRAMTMTAMKASVKTMVRAADAGFTEGKSVETQEMAATRAAMATAVGAVRAIATMMVAAAVVECGERNIAAAVGVASGEGLFKR